MSDGTPTSGKKTRFRQRRYSPALVALAVACVIALVAALVLSGLWLVERNKAGSERTQRAVSMELRGQYVDTASRVMTHIMTIRQDTLKEDIERIKTEIEGDFEQQFAPRTESYEEILKTTKVIADGQIIAAGVEKELSDSADVVMSVDQSITNPTTKKPEKRNYRMRITVTRNADGLMKVSGVNFIP